MKPLPNKLLDLHNYNWNSHGAITDPGKFEGEMLYMPYFWQVSLDGCGDIKPNGVISVEIEDLDIKAFEDWLDYFQTRGINKVEGLVNAIKKLKKKKVVRFYEQNDGFVSEC